MKELIQSYVEFQFSVLILLREKTWDREFIAQSLGNFDHGLFLPGGGPIRSTMEIFIIYYH